MGLLQFITFRLADSLPQEKLQQLKEELKEMEEAELGLSVPGKQLWMREYGIGISAMRTIFIQRLLTFTKVLPVIPNHHDKLQNNR